MGTKSKKLTVGSLKDDDGKFIKVFGLLLGNLNMRR